MLDWIWSLSWLVREVTFFILRELNNSFIRITSCAVYTSLSYETIMPSPIVWATRCVREITSVVGWLEPLPQGYRASVCAFLVVCLSVLDEQVSLLRS